MHPKRQEHRKGDMSMNPGMRPVADDEEVAPVTILDGLGRVVRIVPAEGIPSTPRSSRAAEPRQLASQEGARQAERERAGPNRERCAALIGQTPESRRSRSDAEPSFEEA